MDSKKTWRKKARKYLAEAFGGKCVICGYDKTIAAFDYHHIESKTKDKQLSLAMKNGLAWSKIVEEARKCTLVCCRCHRELHAGVTELPETYARFNEDYVDVMRLPEKEFDSCPICNRVKPKRYSFCSTDCCYKSRRRFVVSKEELQKLVEQNTYEFVGNLFGVSGRSIKNRCKLLGIKLEPRRKTMRV